MKLSRGARRDNLFNTFFRCPSALALICMKLVNVSANKLSLSLSLSLSPLYMCITWRTGDVVQAVGHRRSICLLIELHAWKGWEPLP